RRVCAELRRHGLTTATSVTVALRAYRPGRRAVVEVSSPGGQRWFVKVVRPAALDGLLERHRLMSPQTPVMPVLGHTSNGAVILPVAPGSPVRTLIAAGAEPPSAEALENLLDGLSPAVAALPQRVSPLAQTSDFAAMIAHIGNGELRCAAYSLAQDLQNVDAGDSQPVAVHGDFHEGQLLAAGGTVTGLLDVDTAGAGQRDDEWATLIGHLAVSRNVSAQQYCAAIQQHAERRTDASRLRARVSAVLLGLATGPFRVQHPHWPTQTAARLTQARRWLTG
ncbi:MAG: phosphotransferase, partial [Mycobacterium sp.]